MEALVVDNGATSGNVDLFFSMSDDEFERMTSVRRTIFGCTNDDPCSNADGWSADDRSRDGWSNDGSSVMIVDGFGGSFCSMIGDCNNDGFNDSFDEDSFDDNGGGDGVNGEGER